MRHGGEGVLKTHAKLLGLARAPRFEMSFTRTGRYLLITGFVVNPRRIIITVYAVVLLALGGAAGAVFLDARAQYQQLKQLEASNRRKLADAQSRLAEQERTLERLKTDPEFVERAVRQKLHYAKPGEAIFRFRE